MHDRLLWEESERMRFYASSGMIEKLCELLISTSFQLSGNAGNGAHLRITFVLLRYGVKFSLMLKPFIHWQVIVYRSVLREFRFALTLKQQLLEYKLEYNRLKNRLKWRFLTSLSEKQLYKYVGQLSFHSS